MKITVDSSSIGNRHVAKIFIYIYMYMYIYVYVYIYVNVHKRAINIKQYNKSNISI